MFKKLKWLLYACIATFLSSTNALRCYTCTYTPTTTDGSCISNPDAVSGQKITSCSKKYCVILRQELQKPSGIINTFLRGCEDKPLYLNNVIEDPSFKTYYRSCTSDLCNTGDGIRSSGANLDPDQGAGDNMIIPGRSGADEGTHRSVSFLFTIGSVLVYFLGHKFI